MKKFLCVLIFSTFLGSSFSLFSVGVATISFFRLIFLAFLGCHLVKISIDRGKGIVYPFLNRYKVYLLFLSACILITFNQAPDISRWINGLIFMFINIVLIYFVFFYTDSEKDLKMYIKAYMVGIFVTILTAIYEYETGNHLVATNYLREYSVRSWEYSALSKAPTGFLFNPNNIGVAMLLGLSFGLYFVKNKSTMASWKFLIWSALCIYAALATGSRGAIVMIFVAFFFSAMGLSSNLFGKVYAIMIVIVIAIVGYYIFYDFIWGQVETSGIMKTWFGNDRDTDRARVQMIEVGWEIFKDTNLVGSGPYCAEIMIGWITGAPFSLHNFWMELLATMGLGGFIFFIAFYLRCIKAQLRLINKSVVAHSLVVSMLVFVVAGMIPPTIVTLHFVWLLFGFSLANEKVCFKVEMEEREKVEEKVVE